MSREIEKEVKKIIKHLLSEIGADATEFDDVKDIDEAVRKITQEVKKATEPLVEALEPFARNVGKVVQSTKSEIKAFNALKAHKEKYGD